MPNEESTRVVGPRSLLFLGTLAFVIPFALLLVTLSDRPIRRTQHVGPLDLVCRACRDGDLAPETLKARLGADLIPWGESDYAVREPPPPASAIRIYAAEGSHGRRLVVEMDPPLSYHELAALHDFEKLEDVPMHGLGGVVVGVAVVYRVPAGHLRVESVSSNAGTFGAARFTVEERRSSEGAK